MSLVCFAIAAACIGFMLGGIAGIRLCCMIHNIINRTKPHSKPTMFKDEHYHTKHIQTRNPEWN